VNEADPPETDAELRARALAVIADRLPTGWRIDPVLTKPTRQLTDEHLVVTSPDGTSTGLVTELELAELTGRDVAPRRDKLQRKMLASGAGGLILARYLSAPVRARLTNAGLSYADLTGNIRLSLPRPGLFIADRGADRDPWRGPGRPPDTLTGSAAAKVIRALLDFGGSWTTRDLVALTEVSAGSIARVVKLLESEELLTRSFPAVATVPDWVALLRRWSMDFGFSRNSHVSGWISPDGPEALTAAIARTTSLDHVLTGSLAAATWTSTPLSRTAMIYTPDAVAAAEAWNLTPSPATADVLLAEPHLDVVFTRARRTPTGTRVAALSQVAADLLTGPGQSPTDAEKLIPWMQHNESTWRL
jgi:hypothetical protein